jgi:hypothetical protein
MNRSFDPGEDPPSNTVVMYLLQKTSVRDRVNSFHYIQEASFNWYSFIQAASPFFHDVE